MTKWWEIFLLFVVMIFPTIVKADTITLTSGKNVEGRIIRQDDKSVLVDTGLGTPLTFYRDEIADIVSTPYADPSNEADKLENEAVELIDSGKRSDGFAKMVKAINLDPNPLRQMNYASILFGDGVEAYKKGNREKGLAILKDCEKQLKEAIARFDPNIQQAYVSQCYFLLGEMYANAFANKETAKSYYQKAVELSEHPAAIAALERIAHE